MIHNETAIKLYKKMGFKVEGLKEKSLKVDGKYVDEFYMAKILTYTRFAGEPKVV